MTDYLHPVIFYQLDYGTNYCEDFGLLWFIPEEPHYIPVYGGNNHYFSYDAYWEPGAILWAAQLRWTWEYEVDGQTEIGYHFVYGYPSQSSGGDLDNPGYDYHKPILKGYELYFTRVAESNYDIMSAHFVPAQFGFASPELLIPDWGN
ncbi:hypothetical protein KKA08_08895, partial [bacterium]|nr:hypothetical protein [bacterium]